jgi:hypothetical protein
VSIPGIAGPVAVDIKLFIGRHLVTVGGKPAARVGRNTYVLPGSNGGLVDAKLRSGLFDPYPMLEIDGVKHRTGPSLPAVLRVLVVLPLALLAGGALGGLIGATGLAGNMVIARTGQSAMLKAALMLAVTAAAAVVWLGLATAFSAAIGS